MQAVSIVGRTPTGLQHPKLTEHIHADMWNYTRSSPSSRRSTHDMTIASAATLVRLNPQIVFLFVSGAGADSTEPGSSMWASIKGQNSAACPTTSPGSSRQSCADSSQVLGVAQRGSPKRILENRDIHSFRP